MKKTGLLLFLALGVALAASAQQTPTVADAADPTPDGTLDTRASFPVGRVQTPTYADLYCAGFISKKLMPNANYVAGGLQTPSTTQFVNGDIIYLTGKGYELGQQYTILRELRNPNKNEVFPGQDKILKQVGQPYAELARIKVIDTRNKMAIGEIEFGCSPVVPGDIAVPFQEKAQIPFRLPMRFDRFAPPNGKVSGRIVMARDFDSEIGTGAKVYMNFGAKQGVKVGDYIRATRPYDADLHDPVDSLSFAASISEDTQKKPASIDQGMLGKTSGPNIHVRDLPRRAVGEIVVVGTTDTTSTGMLVFALEDVHVGDLVELDAQQN
jgi:hypothetical protein